MSCIRPMLRREDSEYMLTRSKAAILRLSEGAPLVVTAVVGCRLAKSKLSFIIRHVILSGSFFDTGVKKLDTAFSEDRRPSVSPQRRGSTSLLVIVDSTLRFFKGGGDKDASLAFIFALAG